MSAAESVVVPLDAFLYQDMHWCSDCGGRRMFVPVYETDFGRLFLCSGCEQPKFVEFSHTTTEGI